MLVTQSMWDPGRNMDPLIFLNDMNLTCYFKGGYASKDIKKLFSLIVKVADFCCSLRYTFLYHAEISRLCEMPAVADITPNIMPSIFYGYDCHMHFLCNVKARSDIIALHTH